MPYKFISNMLMASVAVTSTLFTLAATTDTPSPTPKPMLRANNSDLIEAVEMGTGIFAIGMGCLFFTCCGMRLRDWCEGKRRDSIENELEEFRRSQTEPFLLPESP
jgi:hypothetical protein